MGKKLIAKYNTISRHKYINENDVFISYTDWLNKWKS